MKPPAEENPEDRFEKVWRKWVRRSTRQSPAEAAARVGALIRERPGRRQPIWAYAAAAVLLVAISVAVHWSGMPNQPAPAPQTSSAQKEPQLGQGEVLMWLDEDTPLYMTFQPPEAGETKGGKL